MLLKNQILFIPISEAVAKYAIYAAVFWVPVVFAPRTADVLDFNKQVVFSFLIFASLFLWMIGTLVSGKIVFNVNRVQIAAGILFLLYLTSTIFSVSRYGSFWGWPNVTSASLLSVMGFLALYFLVSSTFGSKQILHCFKLLGASSLGVFLYGILQIFGFYLLPLAFTKNSSFNTIGSVATLGIFAAALLPLYISLFILVRKWWKLLFFANIVCIVVVLFLVNYTIVWWVAATGCATIVFFWAIKRNRFDGKWMFLPMFFLIVFLFFIMFSPQAPWLPQKPLEVRLPHATSFGIIKDTLRFTPLLGSGPGTFAYDFAKYKNKDFNKSPLWDITPHTASSQVLTDVATTGILGFLASLVLVGFIIFYATRYIVLCPSIIQKESENTFNELSLVVGMVAVIVAGTVGYFLYTTNFSLNMLYFLCMGSLVALIFKHNRHCVLRLSSLLHPMITFIGMSVLVFGLGLLMFLGQRYVANIHYNKALAYWHSANPQESLRYFKLAASQNSDLDTYFNQLAIFSLVNLQSRVSGVNTNALSNTEAKKIQSLVLDAVNASNTAVKLNPNEVNNWSTKGYICQNIIGFVPDALDCSILSYDRAIALSPTNPYLLLQQGNAYLAAVVNANLPASLQASQPQDRIQLLLKAKAKFEAAIGLKSDYALAYTQLALVAKLQNNPTENQVSETP